MLPPQNYDDILEEYLSSVKNVPGRGVGPWKSMPFSEAMEGNSSRAYVRPKDEEGSKAMATLKEEDDGASSDDGSIYDHPFFDGLKEPPKEEQWDAETILSTYTTTENHPTTVRVARKPKATPQIMLDKRTGLPVGTMLPAEEERLRAQQALTGLVTAGRAGAADEEDDEDYTVYGGGGGFNAGAPRPKKEGADEKRERKAAAKAAKAERRVEKKGTKEAFREEKASMEKTRSKTVQLPATSLSRFGS